MFAIIIALIVLFVALFVGALQFKKHEKMLGTEGAAQAIVKKFDAGIYGYFAGSVLMLALFVFGCSLGLASCVFPVVVFAMTTEILGGELVQLAIAKIILARGADSAVEAVAA